MRNLASALISGNWVAKWRSRVAVLMVTAGALAAPSMASAATTVQIGAAYQSSSGAAVNVGETFDLVYTIQNSGLSTLSGVSFTDTLPSGIVLDDNPGETPKGCASGDQNPSANVAGGSTITISGVSVASGGSCTISFAVVANTPLPAASTIDSIANVTPGDAGVKDAAGINVYADPTITLTPSVNGTKYAYGANVHLSLGVIPGAGDTIPAGNLYGTDDQGNLFNSGSVVNTTIPGQHQVTAWAQTAAGYLGSKVFRYTVGSPSLRSVRATKTGHVEFAVRYLAQGSVAAQALDGKTVVAKLTKKVAAGVKTRFVLSLTPAGRALLAKNRKSGINVKLSVLFTAADFAYVGNQPTITRSGIHLK